MIELAIIIGLCVLLIAVAACWYFAWQRGDRMERAAYDWREGYTRNLADLNGEQTRHQSTRKELGQLDTMWHAQIGTIGELQSKVDALLELWRNAADRALKLDNALIREVDGWKRVADMHLDDCVHCQIDLHWVLEHAKRLMAQQRASDDSNTANRILYERTANERDAMQRRLRLDGDAMIVLNQVRIEGQARWEMDMVMLSEAHFAIEKYKSQQEVADFNIQRLEAERDAMEQDANHYESVAQQRLAAIETQRRWNDSLNARIGAIMRVRDEAVQNAAWEKRGRQKYWDSAVRINAELTTQRRWNDSLCTVNSRLMDERTAARGLADGWQQTAGELEVRVKELETQLVVKDNAITRLDRQLMTARANDTGRDPTTGRFVPRGKK